MAAFVKIFGERHTNTNYLQQLITLNLEVTQLPGVAPKHLRTLERWLPFANFRDNYFDKHFHKHLGWKHACVDNQRLQQSDIFKQCLFLTLTKNPYAWLVSLHRRPYHYLDTITGTNFKDFLQTPWQLLPREQITEQSLTPIELWNKKNYSYLSLASQYTLNLTSEALLEKPEQVVQHISERICLPLKGSFQDITQSTKKTTKDRAFYKDYYLNQRWLSEYTEETLAIVNTSIDKELMQHFGYSIIS